MRGADTAEPHGHLCRDGQHAFGTDDRCEQVQTWRIRRAAPELHRLTFHGHTAHSQYVVHGESILQAMHPARILGDVAADRAGNLARRIGGVVKAMRRGRFADREVADARLNRRGAGMRIDLYDPIELRQRQQHAGAMGQCAARQACASAAGYHRDRACMTEPKHLRDLDLRLREDDNHRQLTVQHEAIALVRLRLLRPP